MRAFAITLSLLALACPALCLGAAPAPGPAKAAQPKRKGIDKGPAKSVPERPVKITSDAFEVLAGEKQARWKGNVVVLRDDMKIQCKALLADYDDLKRLKRLTCTGSAHMRQAPNTKTGREEREIWGEVAVFDNDTAILTVTGSPRGREGANTMQGEKVVFDSNADKLRVEGRVDMVLQTPAGKDPLAPKPAPTPTPAPAPSPAPAPAAPAPKESPP